VWALDQGEDLPVRVDLPRIVRVEDQGRLGSCVANAVTSAMEYAYSSCGEHVELSRLALYYRSRAMDGWEEQDNGTYVRQAIKAAAMYGVPTEESWPYRVSMFAVDPKSCDREARRRRIVSYVHVQGLNGLRSMIADGSPVAFGFSVPASMQYHAGASDTGIVPLPRQQEHIVGGHAVLAMGYDDEREMVRFCNSWGEGWGDEGYGWIPYDYFDLGLASDLWTIKEVT
jgi:C1A family cysteine protease